MKIDRIRNGRTLAQDLFKNSADIVRRKMACQLCCNVWQNSIELTLNRLQDTIDTANKEKLVDFTQSEDRPQSRLCANTYFPNDHPYSDGLNLFGIVRCDVEKWDRVTLATIDPIFHGG